MSLVKWVGPHTYGTFILYDQFYFVILVITFHFHELYMEYVPSVMC